MNKQVRNNKRKVWRKTYGKTLYRRSLLEASDVFGDTSGVSVIGMSIVGYKNLVNINRGSK